MNVLMKAFVFGTLFLLAACGVKGKPQPPLTPSQIGRGEPNFSKASKEVQNRKRPNLTIPGDFEDEDDEDEQ